jgi:hypothetical protein
MMLEYLFENIQGEVGWLFLKHDVGGRVYLKNTCDWLHGLHEVRILHLIYSLRASLREVVYVVVN